MVFLVDQSPGLYARALSLEGELPRFEVPLPPPPQSVHLEALVYDRTLEALGIPAGVLSTTSSLGVTRALPRPDRVQSALVVDEGQPIRWTSEPEASARIDAVRIPARPSPCASFEAEISEVGDPAMGALALPLDATSVLLGTGNGLYRWSPDGVTRIPFPQGRILTGASTESGRVLIGVEPSGIWAGRWSGTALEGGFLPKSPDGGACVDTIAAGDVGAGFELYTLSCGGALGHYDGTGWNSMGPLPVMPQAQHGPHSMVWLGPGSALMISLVSKVAVRIRDRTVTEEVVLGDYPPTTLALVPGFGPVIGNSDGQLLSPHDNGWAFLPGNPTTHFVRHVAKLGDGLIFGGSLGNVGQWWPEHGYCPLRQLAPIAIEFIVPLGEGFVLFGNPVGTRNTPVTYLRRKP